MLHKHTKQREKTASQKNGTESGQKNFVLFVLLGMRSRGESGRYEDHPKKGRKKSRTRAGIGGQENAKEKLSQLRHSTMGREGVVAALLKPGQPFHTREKNKRKKSVWGTESDKEQKP